MKYHVEELQAEYTNILRAAIEVCEKNNIPYFCQFGTVLGAVRHKAPIPWDLDADIGIPNHEIDRFIACCERDLPNDYWLDYYTLNPSGGRMFPKIGKRGFSTGRLSLDVYRIIGLPDAEDAQLRMIEEAQSYFTARNVYYTSIPLLVHKYKLKCIPHICKTLKARLKHDTSFIDKLNALCARYPYADAEYVTTPFGHIGALGAKSIVKKEIYGEGQLAPYSDFQVRIPSDADAYLRQYYGDYMQFPPKEHIDAVMNRTYMVRKAKHGCKQK